jgi:hypothetical protein
MEFNKNNQLKTQSEKVFTLFFCVMFLAAGKSNAQFDLSANYFKIHINLHEGEIFTLGGNGLRDMAYYSHAEEYYRILGGNTACIDRFGRVSFACRKQFTDQINKHKIFFGLLTLSNFLQKRAANALPPKIKIILSDADRPFHLEEMDENTWRLLKQKSSENVFLITLNRDKGIMDGHKPFVENWSLIRNRC